MSWNIPLSDLDYGVEEVERVSAVLRSKWLSMGALTAEFEQSFAEFLGVRHACLVASGTAALHLANLAVGVEPGDEVIVPSLTFVASANASIYCGATPVFADITGVRDLNLSPAQIENKIGPRTKAITVVHYGGYPVDLDSIRSVAAKHGVAVIEDAAHAPGASYNGKMVGAIGSVGCFSFFANKNLAIGEGGALVTNDDQVADKVRSMRSHGMTTLTYERHKGHAFSYDVVRLGYNYRPSEITAALAIVQLEKLRKNTERRRELTLEYRSRLSAITELIVPFDDEQVSTAACHIMPIILPAGADRGAVMRYLRDKGIQTSIHYPPIHRFSLYCQSVDPATREGLMITELVGARELSLPLHPLMSSADIDAVCRTLDDALRLY
jgi:dTDP-4-amino-4,6-dideoxygalactose transaminase